VKRRQELEEMCAQRTKELEDLKQKLTQIPKSTQLTAEQRKSRRMTKYYTFIIISFRNVKINNRMSVHVASSLDQVLSQIGGLDKKIRAAEAAKIQAEDKLMEIAIAKLEVDELVASVDSILKKIIDQFDKFSPAQVKEMIVKLRANTATVEEGGTSSQRFSIIIPQEGLAIQEEIPEAPPMPPVNMTALDQIRSGKPLNNLSVAKLKEEQKQFREKAKQTMGNMKSLEDVLRSALQQRVINMNLYEDEEDEEEPWE
jgi:hypothetical protein